MVFKSDQRLDEWVIMLDALYGGSQNYSKTAYEMHAHLTEVCGIFAKHAFKRRDLHQAIEFLPKIFAWSVALFKKMNPGRCNLEEVILRKFPGKCTYCLKKPCGCWTGEKPTLPEIQLRQAFFNEGHLPRRTLNDFQLMFREIYGESWLISDGGALNREATLKRIFIRLVEELAEVGEAIRFHHLFPENFENELADVLAWWFALVSMISGPEDSDRLLLAEDCVWRAYPGHCHNCQMIPCLCRPGPVRQLMSKPVPGSDHRFDSLTSALNQAAYFEDIARIEANTMLLSFPAACVRADVDNFKSVNDTFGHAAGDKALKEIASAIRRTVRERDRVYRISGDEFGVLCANFTEEEAAGAMRRVCAALRNTPIRWVSKDGKVEEFLVSLSIGVAEFDSGVEIQAAFDAADKAAYETKRRGKGSVTRATSLAEPQVDGG